MLRPVEAASLLAAGLSPAKVFDGTTLSPEVEFALEIGAPLQPILIQLDQIQQNQERTKQELAQALAVPRATRQLLLWLPLLAAVMSQFLGLSNLADLANPLVLVSLALAAGLLLLGAKISRRQLLSLNPNFDISLLQRMLIAVSAGMGLSEISAKYPDIASNPATAALVRLSVRTGAALIPLIGSEIHRALADQLADQIQQLRKLSVRLLIPLGLTTLPAFMLLTIPPILVGSFK